MARQAYDVTPMNLVGEVHCSLIPGSSTLDFDALVARQVHVVILARNLFLAKYEIAICPAKCEILIGGTDVAQCGTPVKFTPQSTARRTPSFLLRSPQETVVHVLPGDYLHLTTSLESDPDSSWPLQPKLDSLSNLPRKPEAV